MSTPSGRSQVPIPPPPPSWRDRLRARVRRVDRAGHRGVLLAVAAVVGAVVAGLLAVVVALLLQPRFTTLELGAQRFAPDIASAQPPVEEVGRYGAFDRRYAVRFTTPDGGLSAVLDTAREQRWALVDRTGPVDAVLHRGGVVAVVSVDGTWTRVETTVAGWVRTRQRQAVIVAVVAGALLAVRWVWRQVRGRPRPIGPVPS